MTLFAKLPGNRRRQIIGWEDNSIEVFINKDFETAGIDLSRSKNSFTTVNVPALRILFASVVEFDLDEMGSPRYPNGYVYNPKDITLPGYSASEIDAIVDAGKSFFDISEHSERDDRKIKAIKANIQNVKFEIA